MSREAALAELYGWVVWSPTFALPEGMRGQLALRLQSRGVCTIELVCHNGTEFAPALEHHAAACSQAWRDLWHYTQKYEGMQYEALGESEWQSLLRLLSDLNNTQLIPVAEAYENA